jgi:type I restriction enzyme R subunit
VERLRALIEEYNAGSLNVDEMLRRLQSLSLQLSDEEQRTVREGLSEPELAVFDLLTRPDPPLSDAERSEVKGVARKLMSHIEEKLVLDWRKKAETREAARGVVKDILDELPVAYDPETYDRKCEIVFNHIFASYYDDGHSVYDDEEAFNSERVITTQAPPGFFGRGAVDVAEATEQDLEEISEYAGFAEAVARQLEGAGAFFAVPTAELIESDESFAVEFKSTARWNLEEARKDKRMEDAVVKTVAAFLNADGGVLLIGVADDRSILGLEHDCAVVKPANADGFVNWLTGHLIRALRNPAVMRTRTRIEMVDGTQVCRVDVARSSVPVRAKMSDKDDVFWVRMNNSSRAWPDEEIAEYIADHWGARLS